MFRFVIQHNEVWQAEDEVIAAGNCGAVIAYDEVKRKRQGFA